MTTPPTNEQELQANLPYDSPYRPGLQKMQENANPRRIQRVSTNDTHEQELREKVDAELRDIFENPVIRKRKVNSLIQLFAAQRTKLLDEVEREVIGEDYIYYGGHGDLVRHENQLRAKQRAKLDEMRNRAIISGTDHA